MGIFLVYILKSSVCLTLFYLFYKLLLSRDTFYRFNRIALLGLIILSAVIPFCMVTVKEPQAIQQSFVDLEALLLSVQNEVAGNAVSTPSLWLTVLLWIYIGGSLFFCLQYVYSFYRMYRILKTGKKIQQEKGIQLIVTEKLISPFSWMNYIVISQKDMEESGHEIQIHEMAHVKARHSIDLLISDIFILFHWFNPAVWLLKQELQNVHEYEADESVLKHGIDAKKYQLLLIKKAVGSQRFTSMANSFNHSSLKKRITMMLKRKSNSWARLKYVYVLPLAAIAVTAFARPEISNELEKISSVKVNEIIPVKEIVTETIQPQDEKKKKTSTIVKEKEEKEPSKNKVIVIKKEQKESEDTGSEPVKKHRVFVHHTELSEPKGAVESNSPIDDFKKFEDALILINDVEATPAELEKLNVSTIESVHVLKDDAAVEEYGEKAKNGVIKITIKK